MNSAFDCFRVNQQARVLSAWPPVFHFTCMSFFETGGNYSFSLRESKPLMHRFIQVLRSTARYPVSLFLPPFEWAFNGTNELFMDKQVHTFWISKKEFQGLLCVLFTKSNCIYICIACILFVFLFHLRGKELLCLKSCFKINAFLKSEIKM